MNNTSITGGIKYLNTTFGYSYYTTGNGVTFNSNYITLLSGTNSTNNVHVHATTTDKFDLTNYTKINIEYMHSRASLTLPYSMFRFAIHSTDYFIKDYIHLHSDKIDKFVEEYISDEYRGILIMDISDYIGLYYIILENYYAGYSKFYSIYLS